jgi:hypothetical protein
MQSYEEPVVPLSDLSIYTDIPIFQDFPKYPNGQITKQIKFCK